MVLATRRTMDAGIRKAAVLVSCLDQLSADLLLEQLGEEQAGRVRLAAVELDEIDEEERRRVIDEFRRIGPMVPDAAPAGIELTDLPPRCIAPSAPEEAAAAGDASPFQFLHETEDEQLVHLLAEEQPQIVALVMSHLPPERAAYVIDRIPPQQQVEVVRRLAALENTDAETLREIEQVLEARMSRLIDCERRRSAGPQSVARILSVCDELQPPPDTGQHRRRRRVAGRAIWPPRAELRRLAALRRHRAGRGLSAPPSRKRSGRRCWERRRRCSNGSCAA